MESELLVNGLVVAIDAHKGIGFKGKLPWGRVKEDLAHFHKLTCEGTGTNVVVMGNSTFESLPAHFRPLPKRINVVVTRSAEQKLDNDYSGDYLQDIYFVPSYESALTLCRKLRENKWADRVFGIGGASCYSALAPHAQALHVTLVEGEYLCDTHFPTSIFEAFEESPPWKFLFKGDALVCSFARYERK